MSMRMKNKERKCFVYKILSQRFTTRLLRIPCFMIINELFSVEKYLHIHTHTVTFNRTDRQPTPDLVCVCMCVCVCVFIFINMYCQDNIAL